MMSATLKILTISQLNIYARSLLDADPNLQYVFATGEISNLKSHYASGHFYMSLKDKNAVINAVMFKTNAQNLKFMPENGMSVIVRGRVSIYEASGQYQLYIEDMQPDGIGALAFAFEQLKLKLEKEGIFEAAHKKPIPQFPNTIGIITAKTGAAVQDILSIIRRRYPIANILLYPVLVQGEEAVEQLISAVNNLSENKLADVIIIGRGGGSIEDLWAFNSEALARAVYNCSVPIISAVGHETDFTICDFAADLRAATPSSAAELAVPDAGEIGDTLNKTERILQSVLYKKLSNIAASISTLDYRIKSASPSEKLSRYKTEYIFLEEKLKRQMTKKLEKIKQSIETRGQIILRLSPNNVLNRGYTVITKDGENINSVLQLTSGEMINLTFKDGNATAIVN